MNNEYISIYLLAVVIASISQIILKISANKEESHKLFKVIDFYMFFAYGLLMFSMLMTTFALKKMYYKYGAMMEGVGYLCVLVMSMVFLKEKISRKRLLGALIIVVGIVIFSL